MMASLRMQQCHQGAVRYRMPILAQTLAQQLIGAYECCPCHHSDDTVRTAAVNARYVLRGSCYVPNCLHMLFVQGSAPCIMAAVHKGKESLQ
jgi:hypothetical protein